MQRKLLTGNPGNNGPLKEKLPVATIIIVALNLIGLIYEYSVGEERAIYTYAMYEGALQRGEYVRLFVSAFLHFGLYHFGSNMVCLAVYGLDLERRLGPWRYALIYGLSIIGAGLLINHAGGRGLHAGASGAIWGLMTATVIYNLRNQLNPAYALRGIAINLLYSFSSGVSWQGHIGGGLAGLVTALLICRGPESGNRMEGESGRHIESGNRENAE